MHPQVRWVLSRQVAISAALALGVWGVAGSSAAISALLGGAIGVIANFGYVWRAMRAAPGSDPLRAYRAQAAGEALKFALTVILFALVFMHYKTVAVLPLFMGYVSTFVIFWVALLKQR